MISTQTIQTSLDELKAITKVELGVYDTSGITMAETARCDDISSDIIKSFANSPADSQIIGNYHLLKIFDDEELLFVLVAWGTAEDVYMIGKVAVCQLKNLAIAYKERYDRDNFFQNLILDNLLLVDIYNRAKKLHIETTVPRAVFIVEGRFEKDSIVTEILHGMYSAQAGDFITAVDEQSVILIKALDKSQANEQLQRIAETIVTMINTEALINVKVAYGTVVDELKEVSKSYKEAKMALDVGRIFYAEKNVVAYSALGIGRLIYQLPVNLCKLFIEEIFGDNITYELDEETLNTLN
ncbi:MAG: PucR family transcriptional regulator, partial [Lachnospiraceae bacterium]|nr:PucR family transcriptional regulator [Lachnospiraceae bacterium]